MASTMKTNDASSETFRRLAGLSTTEKVQCILRLIEEHPQRRLELSEREGSRAELGEIDIGSSALSAGRSFPTDGIPRWWSTGAQGVNLARAGLRGANLRFANLERADLRDADLERAVLGKADLRHAHLHGANLKRADLAGANLQAAQMEDAELQGALLEDADLQRASLRFADLQEAVLEHANLEHADLWGTCAAGADFKGADLRDAVLYEADLRHADLTEADLRHAKLDRANLEGATLTGADLRDCLIKGVNLDGAILKDARLESLDLVSCRISHFHVSGACLDRTRLRREQLGGAIGEELNGEYEDARLGYLALERNFEAIGDPDAASWAYRKKRRMQKLEALSRGRVAFQNGQWRSGVAWWIRYGSDQLVEWICDYGESIPRVLMTILAVWLIFAVLYGVTDGILKVTDTATGSLKTVTHDPLDLVVFGLQAMTASWDPESGFLPRNEGILFLMNIQTLVTIALTGLLGFVLGHRIRR